MTIERSAPTDTDGFRLFPAIDLRGGRCVRLYQGDYDRETTYGDDPVAQARSFVAEGAEVLHVVDLDAARSGEPVNREVIAAICAALPVPVQVGGGVRSVEAAEALFAAGVDRVVIGTAAVENPGLVTDLVGRGRSVVVGLDARGDEVATHGWTTSTGRAVADLAGDFADIGVAALVVTEIGRDGTMEGPDVDGLRALLDATDIPVIASGGVGLVGHLRSLASVRSSGGDPLAGAIVGRALYEGKFSVAQALAAIAGAGNGARGGAASDERSG
ncbi:MAG: 1-(5-phosphoribosyl)-5-[(5-phosphoribosylamino)methylideneamino]imidazole-4-carboxamide isomerase [Actinomycetota bacterium]